MSEWQPIETAPKEDYEEILVLVPQYDEPGFLVRLAMWDPENTMWTIFGLNWQPEPLYWAAVPNYDHLSKPPASKNQCGPIEEKERSDDDEASPAVEAPA
jgi:hypothetical protein